ncbi:nucleotide pyrophosphohydrolase [Timonella senegalensis]|uniref:nucleotide pyrophosphohydrolase n=1 Tax=Timonella senegalensis TaxID=1465825 RepID=UPI0002D2FC1F|nr:nucleotide pyrophosphohydrolase [Timonella senegalensis]
MTSISQFTADVRAFSEERDWPKFQDPKSLLLALMGEVGEVAELMQWTREADVVSDFESPERNHRVGDELADVFIYLVRLADVLGVDLGQAAEEKLERNRSRFPTQGPDSIIGKLPSKR